MPTRAEIIAEDRSWIKTPYVLQGRTKGVAADCFGVHLETARVFGCVPQDFDFRNYGALPDPKKMEELIDSQLDRIKRGEERPGDIGLMPDPYYGGAPRHLVMLTDVNLIVHAHSEVTRGQYKTPGMVVEQRFPVEWRRMVKRFYRLRGLDD